jgi:hypothetical protein
MEVVDLALGELRKNDIHEASLLRSSGTACLDAPQYRVSGYALGRVGEIRLMARDHFLTEPAFHGRVTLEQSADPIAHHFADSGIMPRLYFAFNGFSHIIGQRDAKLLGRSHLRIIHSSRI